MDTTESSAHEYGAHPIEDTSHGCYDGLVFIGHMIEEDGGEVEVFEAVPCRRCSDKA